MRGLGLASKNYGSWITAFAMTLCGGCLVTEQIDFQTPTDYPPEILKAPDGPAVGDIINLIKSERPNYQFNVRIRDLNVDQELTARVRLVKEPGEKPPFEPLIVQRGDKPERDLAIPVPINSLTAFSCHRLDLVVSGSFGGVQGEPSFDGIAAGSNDIARAMWWIFEGDLDAAGSAAIAESCPREFTVDMPAVPTAGRGAL